MIKKSKKSKKSTSKKRTFGVSPLICVVAIIEVLVLIGVSTYAWFFIQASKVIGSGTISVAADSGLDIDFRYSNIDDYINIWNYVGSDFTFEPATSLDGRTIYFPTSGTFNNHTTDQTVFRDGTVNDINSKYLSIDFELTNTSENDQYVYLNNKSYFRVQDKNNDDAYEESRALRLAFYQNDGNSGNVGSSLLNSGSSSDGGVIDTSVSSDAYTIYFDNSGNNNWGTDAVPTAYFYDSDDHSSPEFHTAWPGIKMDRIAGQTYKVSIENPPTSYEQASESFNVNTTYYTKTTVNDKDYYNVVKKPVADDFSDYYVATGNVKYDKIIISNNGSNSQRVTYSGNLTLADNGKKFTTTSNSPTAYSEHTIYFVKPYAWEDVYCHTWHRSGDSTSSYTTWPGDEMTYVGSGIYSYTYDSANTGGFLFDDGTGGTDKNQTVNISIPEGASGANDYLYYTQSDGSSNYITYDGSKYKYQVSVASRNLSVVGYSSLQYRTIYFLNSYGWEKPYATVSFGQGSSVTTCDIALTTLSGNVYYCTVPDIVYNYVYFRAKNQVDSTYRTKQNAIVDNQVYRPKGEDAELWYDNGSYYRDVDIFMYDRYIKKTGYPVISPGVSAGFQRPYSPVVTIDASSGEATEIVPAYSNSIDNYILGSGTELFVLKSNHMASLSMIIWLEGTDEACTGETYAGKQIDMRLEFSTKYVSKGQEHIVNPGDSNAYIYNFYDRTREIWTSDRQSTESGVTVAPVMQLYDNTIKRGYLMSPSKYASYDGKQKVSCWTVSAPQSIARNGHDIIFRRVNPYNEDEVWNYWHAGPVAGDGDTVVDNNSLTVYSIAQGTTVESGDTINFTAFADGSPTAENLYQAYLNNNASDPANPTSAEQTAANSAANSAHVPALSCGGLWGDHSVRTVTMLDGMDGQPLKNDRGIITVNYTYRYKVGDTVMRSAAIEYKASGPNNNSLYYIIMPSVAYTNGLTCTFKHYTEFDSGYAINSDRNDEITYEGTYGAGQQITGEYFELTKKTNDTDESYWGSDLLVIQTSWETKDTYLTGSDKNRLMQVHFYSTDTSSNTGAHTDGDRYGYLYSNSSFANSNETAFLAVVPNNIRYYKYAVEVCKYDGSGLRHMTNLQTLTNTTVNVVDSNSETYPMNVNHLNNHNVCKLNEIHSTIYLQTTNAYQGQNQDPQVYSFSNTNGKAWEWRDISNHVMTPVGAVTITDNGNTYSGYKYCYTLHTSMFEMVTFYFPKASKQSNDVSVNTHDVMNGQIFQCNSDNNGKAWVWKLDDGVTGTNNRNDTTVVFYTENAWPHYTSQ